MAPAPALKLTLFDLDGTLLSGDSDALWCEFLLREGVLAAEGFAERQRDIEQRYRAGNVTAQEFCDFYVATLAGRSADEWAPLRTRFIEEMVVPCIPAAAVALVEQHRVRGELLVLTTATCRFLSEPTARHLRLEDLIATEAEQIGCIFTGRTSGTLNMREGKVARLRQWLADRGLPASLLDEATAYSDSINDLPLLEAVREPVAVDPDERLAQVAAERGWAVLRMAR